MNRFRVRTAGAVGVILLTAAVTLAASESGAFSPSQPALAGWPRQLGTTAEDDIYAVATAPTGDVYVTGFTYGPLGNLTSDPDGDAFVAKYDKNGNLKWIRQLGTTDGDGANAIAVTAAGEAYITGYTDGILGTNVVAPNGHDAFVAKYDKNGNLKWVKQLGTSSSESGNGIAVAGTEVFVVGNTSGKLGSNAVNGNATDAWVAKYDKNGNLKWVKQLGTTGNDYVNGVAVAGKNVFIAGWTNGALGTLSTADPLGDAYIASFDKMGNQKWVKQFGTGAYDEAKSIAAVGNDVYATGWTNGALGVGSVPDSNGDVFIVHYDKTGVAKPAAQVGTSAVDGNGDPAIAVSGASVYVASDTHGAFPGFTNQGDLDGFVSRFNRQLTPIWTRQFGTSAGDYVTGIAVRGNNNNGGALVVVGTTTAAVWGQISFGDYDGYIATFPK